MYVCGKVAYDGTDFHGFQYQPDQPTIQGCLENAIAKISSKHTRIVGSGRTDTGVHARGQVFSAHIEWRHDIAALQRAINASLPSSIVVSQLQNAPKQFHPRFSAIDRTYCYYVQYEPNNRSPRSPLTDRFAYYENRQLNIESMNEASDTLIGTHDFATFGQPPQGENTVRQLISAEWAFSTSGQNAFNRQSSLLVFTVTANAFLRRMVRNLVGTLLSVGRGERTPDEVFAALLAQNRSQSSPPAPAHGLVLEFVQYPADLNIFV